MLVLPVCLAFAATALPAQQAQECLIKPSAEVRLSVKTAGVVASVAVARGDSVDAGQVLLTQVDDIEAANLRIAQARAADRSGLEGARARRLVAEAQLERLRQLASGSLVTRERLDEAEQNALILRQEEEAAKAALAIAELEADRARVARERLILHAPLSGVVTSRSIDPGEFASEQTPVLTIASLDPLRIEAWIDAADWGRIARGDRAEIASELDPDSRHTAVVVAVDPVLETVSSSFLVTLNLPNPGGALPAGVTCALYLGEG